MRELSPQEKASTGMVAKVTGQVTNKWSIDDKDTGEVISGAKMSWYGGSGSVQFYNPDQEQLFVEGDLIECECSLNANKGVYKLGKGVLVKVNGNALSKKPA